MSRKLLQLFQPSLQLYFICLILFALASALFSLPLAGLELAIVVLLGVYHRSGLVLPVLHISQHPVDDGVQQEQGCNAVISEWALVHPYRIEVVDGNEIEQEREQFCFGQEYQDKRDQEKYTEGQYDCKWERHSKTSFEMFRNH